MRKYVFIFSLLIAFCYSCEEPIVLNLPSGPQRTVIDANVSESEYISRVILSRSLGFNDTTTFPAIENASVVLFATNFGNTTFPFTYSGTFDYGALYTPQSQVTLVPKQFYTLNVFLPGSEFEQDTLYQAQVRMPTVVPIQDVNFRYEPSEDRYYVRIYFLDPEKENNYYSWRVSQKINGEFILLTPARVPISTDQGIDGKEVFVEYPYTSFTTEDTIQVHLKSLDQSAYNYYVSLNNLIEASGTSITVDNPPTNFASTVVGENPIGFLSVEGVSDSEIIPIADSVFVEDEPVLID
ncbi:MULTISPECIES: DUF4249 family protein [Flammeovirga]|uniref:DUF4249 domain-containing protein n=1 Tax=Flammeovirga agarivorans TaxID=2726742 RepID=A0A7X8SHD2_9BACT|nr:MULTISPECIES: DUF4249 family protein [Flammeovirga]NLR90249.1 DUF4249 domain-containing protein [Flammeovirga agarivorans]